MIASRTATGGHRRCVSREVPDLVAPWATRSTRPRSTSHRMASASALRGRDRARAAPRPRRSRRASPEIVRGTPGRRSRTDERGVRAAPVPGQPATRPVADRGPRPQQAMTRAASRWTGSAGQGRTARLLLGDGADVAGCRVRGDDEGGSGTDATEPL